MELAAINPDEFAALAIPGGFEKAGFYEDAYSEEFLNSIRKFNAMRKPIASICVGALPLAKSGILNGRKATTYHLMEGKRRQQLAELGAQVVDVPIVDENNIITSTSPATAMDVAFRLLAKVTAHENADHIRQLMGFGC
jgi:4-methyl-5(b-hydroxyethyl)-thiazole monophosphate biosynthesis